MNFLICIFGFIVLLFSVLFIYYRRCSKTPPKSIKLILIVCVVITIGTGLLYKFPLESSKVIRGNLLFNKEVFYKSSNLGPVSDIKYGAFYQSSDKVLALTGGRGAVFLDSEKRAVKNVRFPRISPNVLIHHTIEIIDLESDGMPEFLCSGGFQLPAAVFNSEGKLLWTYSSDDEINDTAAGDINGDGLSEVVVGFNGGGGVHLLDSRGNKIWQKPGSNVWRVAIVDTDQNGTLEIVDCSTGGIVLRDKSGKILKDNLPERAFTYFSLTSWFKKGKRPYFLYGNRGRIVVCDFNAETIAELSAPDLEIADPHGTIVQFNNASYFACITHHRSKVYSLLYIYDSSHKLVYQEKIAEPCNSIFALDNALLVGGVGKVWKYTLNET